MKRLNLFIVSDSIGETGELVAKAAVSQFRPVFTAHLFKTISTYRIIRSY